MAWQSDVPWILNRCDLEMLKDMILERRAPLFVLCHSQVPDLIVGGVYPLDLIKRTGASDPGLVLRVVKDEARLLITPTQGLMHHFAIFDSLQEAQAADVDAVRHAFQQVRSSALEPPGGDQQVLSGAEALDALLWSRQLRATALIPPLLVLLDELLYEEDRVFAALDLTRHRGMVFEVIGLTLDALILRETRQACDDITIEAWSPLVEGGQVLLFASAEAARDFIVRREVLGIKANPQGRWADDIPGVDIAPVVVGQPALLSDEDIERKALASWERNGKGHLADHSGPESPAQVASRLTEYLNQWQIMEALEVGAHVSFKAGMAPTIDMAPCEPMILLEKLTTPPENPYPVGHALAADVFDTVVGFLDEEGALVRLHVDSHRLTLWEPTAAPD
ncbi:hypothetical protein [Halomonas sp. YLGW01]|uniref:hypothetical protein n=1 Tax=Halomonas sp. YLGW01 TaxID=2773308 RepID=UPI001786BFA2|nr:hypothetical protein [Halomonas sp. YLGW01]